MECKKCGLDTICKNGKSKSGKQRYKCKKCNYTFQLEFSYQSCLISDDQIKTLLVEGCGIRSIGRILAISPSTVIRRIISISNHLQRPFSILQNKEYQVDELFTFIKYKDNRICVAYSFEPKTKRVINFVVGRRNKTNLRKVIDTLVLSNCKRIITDKLNIYKELIPKEIHSTKHRGINHIERNNLNLRTHLKRLNRKTICYTKSIVMLIAVLKIYFWG